MFPFVFAKQLTIYLSLALSPMIQSSVNPAEIFGVENDAESVVACYGQKAAEKIAVSPNGVNFIREDDSLSQTNKESRCIFIGLTRSEISRITIWINTSDYRPFVIIFNDDKEGRVFVPWPLIKKPENLEW